MAHIDLDPAYIPEGDDFATPVLLDGRSSTSLDGEALEYTWHVRDVASDWRIDPDDEPPPGCADHFRAPCLIARFAGDRPVEIELTVTSPSGSTTTSRMLGLTLE